ncbi:MAG TPA: CBS domain-containing protein [Candidatus Eisenbacteria bacterium]|nr:CBS domain-containing protein [Candidatus Eisenbacteria bacterium]
MSKAEPTIQKYMTMQPYSIEASQTLETAVGFMSDKKIRHLPVTRGGVVIGIISDRDAKMAMGIEGLDASRLPVLDIASEKPYAVTPDMPLRLVAETMASKHYGSAIVTQNGKLVGIFTTVDACRALAEIIALRHHEGP